VHVGKITQSSMQFPTNHFAIVRSRMRSVATDGRTFPILPSERYCPLITKSKGKAVSLQAWSGPEGFRKLRFLDFMTTAQDGGKFVSLTHRSPLPLGNTPGTHFC